MFLSALFAPHQSDEDTAQHLASSAALTPSFFVCLVSHRGCSTVDALEQGAAVSEPLSQRIMSLSP